MRLARAVAVLLLILMAGCSSPPSPTPTAPATDPSAPGGIPVEAARTCIDQHNRRVPPVNGTCPPGPAPQIDAIAFDGHLGAGAHLYSSHLPQPVGAQATEENCEVAIEHPDWTILAANVTATWTADSPATATLTLDVMVMNETSTTMLGSVTGPSPLAVHVAALNLTMPQGTVFHTYVYNQAGFTSLPDGGIYATPDQAVHLGGNVTFRPLPATR